MEHELDIRKILELYTQGTYEGDAEMLRRSFHEKAVMNGYLAGQLMLATPEPFIENITGLSLKDRGLSYSSSISQISINGKVASVTLEETGFPDGVSFTNYFHLIDDGHGWKIISKTFISHP